MSDELDRCLRPTAVLDGDHPDVVRFAHEHAGDTPQESAVRLYYAVRDGIRYDPYTCVLTVDGLKASTVLREGRGWCVSKATLLSACCRALGIPARLGFADVRNHLSTARLRQLMATDVFYWHGYSVIHLGGRWVKATPAFNIELCEKFGILPLDFDGVNDSLYHPFDASGRRHMEYVNDRGEFDDVPIDLIEATFADEYAGMADVSEEVGDAVNFDAEVAEETGR